MKHSNPRHLVVIFILAVAPWSVRPATAKPLLVKGSDTIGGALGPALADAFEQRQPDVDIVWESLGSGTAFVGLFDGSAQLGAASRSVRPGELDEARRLGVQLKEYVLGYDGIAVLVHPSNPVPHLSLDQLAAIFDGSVDDWQDVGGRAGPIHRVSRPSYSGTHGFFKKTVLRRGARRGEVEFAGDTRFVEHSEDIVGAIAGDPAAIAYLGMGWQGDTVRSVPIAEGTGSMPTLPRAQSVRDGSYPIYRPLLLYTRGEPQGDVRRLLSFVLASPGQALVSAQGFVPSDAPCTVCRLPAELRGDDAQTEVTRISFLFGGARLAPAADEALATVARELRDPDAHALVVGHADASGPAGANQRIAYLRARMVARALAHRTGLPMTRFTIESRGEDQPIATNDTPEGRRANRRVDVRILTEASSAVIQESASANL